MPALLATGFVGGVSLDEVSFNPACGKHAADGHKPKKECRTDHRMQESSSVYPDELHGKAD